jgi:hypothetical protein
VEGLGNKGSQPEMIKNGTNMLGVQTKLLDFKYVTNCQVDFPRAAILNKCPFTDDLKVLKLYCIHEHSVGF